VRVPPFPLVSYQTGALNPNPNPAGADADIELFGQEDALARCVFVDQAPLQYRFDGDWELGSNGCFDAERLAGMRQHCPHMSIQGGAKGTHLCSLSR
jgi:hypothetical protein